MIIETANLSDAQKQNVRVLLDLLDDVTKEQIGDLDAYMTELLKQRFILSFDKDVVVGFLSYIPDYNEKYDFVSYVIVHPKYRARGMLRTIYARLFKRRYDRLFFTKLYAVHDRYVAVLRSIGFVPQMHFDGESEEHPSVIYYVKNN